MRKESPIDIAGAAVQPTKSSLTNNIMNGQRTALVMGHPGHELCVYGWLSQARPRVFVLTDGSGRSGKSRIERTTRILDRLGATRGSFYGQLNDAAIYEALLNHSFDLFTRLAMELADTIVRDEVTCVVGDAREGYNPTHDACRLVINAAVAIARQRSDHPINNFEFLAAGRPNNPCALGTSQPISVSLDSATFQEKLAAARDYVELKSDVDGFLHKYSHQTFQTEYLYPVVDCYEHSFADREPVYYEEHGERRVRQGHYDRIIRYREHLLPLARKLFSDQDASAA